jgi:alpha-L-fucosidase 2
MRVGNGRLEVIAASLPPKTPMTDLELWYDKPATEWVEALPIGNGRLGAMVFGGIEREHLQLNEETLWTGGPYSQINTEALPHLQEARDLIFAGRYAEAEALAQKHLMGIPIKQMSYQPTADLWIEMHGLGWAKPYRRSLDLDTAVATTTFNSKGVRFTREVFVSPVDGILVMRLSADRPASLDFTLRLTSAQPGKAAVEANVLEWRGHNRGAQAISGALKFAVRAELITVGGSAAEQAGGIHVAGADEAIILLDAATSFRRFDDVSSDPDAAIAARLAAVRGNSFDAVLQAHIAEHRRLFRRMNLDLGPSRAPNLPTNERIDANPANPDPALAALYLHYARYLMISCSRPGTQPVTLQGIWNAELEPPWGSKYTSNINLQMHYWLPDPANLGECIEPLIAMAEELAVTGAEMAQAHYGARGWVLHHNTDLWRATGPTDGAKWGLWPTGGAWICAQLWDHLRYSWNDALVHRLYPVMAGAARFALDTVVPLPGSDHLVTAPSLSPENVHPHGAALCAGPTMDNQILRDLFAAVLEAADHLAIDPDFRAEVANARNRLPPDRVGKAGQLQEWLDDWDIDAPEIHHRHVSHLYGLYPSLQIDRLTTPELAAAARRSLEIRGDEATGWGIGWRINLWARLRDGDHANAVLTRLLSPDRTYPNMFDAHPPFQIDGNFGGAAGILELLVQSRPGELTLLPALPSAWPTGHITGLRARGGITIDMTWSGGDLTTATLTADRDIEIVVYARGGSRQVILKKGVPLAVG